jgi:hypothetical protein
MVAESEYVYGAEAYEDYRKTAKAKLMATQETNTPEVKGKS